MTNSHQPVPSNEAAEEVEHLSQTVNTKVNEMSSPKPNDPAIPISSSNVPNLDPEAKPMAFAQKTGDKK